MRKTLLFIFLFLFIGFVSSSTINVDIEDVSCDDSSGTPFCSIQAGIDNSTSGDIVNISQGIYDENVVINNKESIEIIGGNLVPSSGIGFVITNSSSITIKDMTINTTGSGAHGIWVGGDPNGFENSDNIIIQKNDININGQSSGIYVEEVNPSHSVFKIKDNYIGAPNLGVNIEFYDVKNALIQGNTLEKSGSVSLVYSSEDSDISNLDIVDNIFLGNGNIAGITPTIWIESDFISGDGDSSITHVDINNNEFYDWENGAILIGEDSSMNFNNIFGNLFVNFNSFFSGTGYALKNNVSAEIDAENNYWGSCDGPSGEGTGSGFAANGNIDFDPWLGVCFSNKTVVSCAFETDDITLEADLTTLNTIEDVWFSYTLNNINYNKTASQISENKYRYIIPSSDLIGGMNVTWNIYANDSYNIYNNSWKTFYIRDKTNLTVIPSSPDGSNNWYITEPSFTLTGDSFGESIYYRWNMGNLYLYSGPFGLENIPNAPPKESAGTLELRWYNKFACGNESLNNQTFHIDLKDPVVKELDPANNSIVTNNLQPNIGAYLDEVYQSNSGINLSSIIMYVDEVLVTPTIDYADTIDAIVNYTPSSNLGLGEHNVTINVTDMAGRNSQLKWKFMIDISDVTNMTIYSPQNINYSSRRVQFNITLSEEGRLEYINYNDRRPRWRRICSSCEEYGYSSKRTKSMKEGENNVSIKLTDQFGIMEEQNISLFVDSKKPRISRTYPRRNKVTNGSDFSIKYTESNVEEIELFFNSSNLSSRIELYNCSSGRNQECSIRIDVSDYDGQVIDYYYNITDTVRTVSSRLVKKVLVDTTDPNITINIPLNDSVSGRRVQLNITVSEEVLLEYYDDNTYRPRWRRLCSRCDEYGESRIRKKSFYFTGQHNVLIRATDKAGNTDVKEVSFTVV